MKRFLAWISLFALWSDAVNITVSWTGGWSCTLSFSERRYPCALGKNGATADKAEGDGMTPLGTFPLRRAFFRADRSSSKCFGASDYLACEAIMPDYAWVDAPTDPLYNQFTLTPYAASHENLYLDSSLYDLFAVIGYNDAPVVPYKGSAIFFHVASAGYGGTAGCVAMKLEDLSYVLSHVSKDSFMSIVDARSS